MSVQQRIKELSIEIFEEVRSFRRHLHANPELSFHEFNTAGFIESSLEKMGVKSVRMAETGVVALIEGQNPHTRCIALRADTDALPILEVNSSEYCSTNPGVMHACGHDAHTASLLGTVKILHTLRSEFQGTIKCIFQPGEERIPGGASLMIAAGVLENPKVELILGQHVMPLLDAGELGFREGMYMASADEIYITIKGKGGHAAHPHTLIDPVTIGAQMIIALQQIVSRNANPAIPSVLSFGKVEAKGATNVIPDQMYIEGTFRTFNEDWRFKAHDLIRKTAIGICESLGAELDIEVRTGYPYLENDIGLTTAMSEAAAEFNGSEKVKALSLWPAGEDFAFYTREIPGCFYRLGVRNEQKGISSLLHTPTFDIDEDALRTGMSTMAWLALEALNYQNK